MAIYLTEFDIKRLLIFEFFFFCFLYLIIKMLLIWVLLLLTCLCAKTNALPMNNKIQTLVYQQNSKPFTAMDNQEQNWYISREYDVYSNLVEHYENLVDTTLNAESEELLLNLIHLPRESMNLALTSQAALLGFDVLTGKNSTNAVHVTRCLISLSL